MTTDSSYITMNLTPTVGQWYAPRTSCTTSFDSLTTVPGCFSISGRVSDECHSHGGGRPFELRRHHNVLRRPSVSAQLHDAPGALLKAALFSCARRQHATIFSLAVDCFRPTTPGCGQHTRWRRNRLYDSGLAQQPDGRDGAFHRD